MRTLFHRTLLQTVFHKLRWGDFAQLVSAAAIVWSVWYLAEQIDENTKPELEKTKKCPVNVALSSGPTAFDNPARSLSPNSLRLGCAAEERLNERVNFLDTVGDCFSHPSALLRQ